MSTLEAPSSLSPPPRAFSHRLVPYLPLALALVLRHVSSVTADVSYLVLAGYALFGREHLLRALVFSWLFTMLSPGLAPDAPLAALGRYFVLFGAAVSAVIHSHLSSSRRSSPLQRETLLLGLVVVAHSVIFSPLPDVSVLKAISWTVATLAILSAWSGLTPLQHYRLSQELFLALALVLFASLPLAVTSVGYLVNGTGFQGILNHPQALGPTLALLCVWATARMIAVPKPPWWLLGLAGTCMVAVIMTEARTAGMAAVLAVGLAVLLSPWLAGRPILSLAPGLRSGRVWAVLMTTALIILFVSATFSDFVDHFITKSGRSSVDDIWGAFEQSRGKLVDPMLENIAEKFWTGIGFGIASDPETMRVSRDPVFGLPLGASIEKGTTPLMVLEELGVFGAGLVAFWVLRLVKTAAVAGITAFGVVLTVLLLNLGEATLFSPGGFGLLPLILLGCAYSSGLLRRRGEYG